MNNIYLWIFIISILIVYCYIKDRTIETYIPFQKCSLIVNNTPFMCIKNTSNVFAKLPGQPRKCLSLFKN